MSRPESIIKVCKTILENWKTEIVKKIYKVYGEPDKGNHIRMALGHPDLKQLAKKTANNIVKAKQENSVVVPDYLFDIAEKMVKEDDYYPEWNLKKKDEPNPE